MADPVYTLSCVFRHDGSRVGTTPYPPGQSEFEIIAWARRMAEGLGGYDVTLLRDGVAVSLADH